MKTKKNILFIILLSFSFFCFSQRKSIPFYVDEQNKIILEYTIKGERVKLFFDTGSNGNIIDVKFSDKVGFLSHKKNREITQTTIGNELFSVTLPDDDVYYKDSVFNCGWVLTDMNKTRKLFNFGNEVDGLVGINFQYNKFVIDLDFKNKQLRFWDSLPQNYLSDTKGNKITLIKTDFAREANYSYLLSDYSSVQGSLTISDTIQLHPYFIFDTGSKVYAAMVVYDSLLLKKMLAYKKMIINNYGDNYPTTRLQIPELGIDSPLVKIGVIVKCYVNNERVNQFGNYKIGGLLGMDFFLQYERILFDCKNRIGYFIKSSNIQ
jgi:hypothetical protein